MFSYEICLRTQGIEPGAAGSRSKNANHCAAQTVCLHLVESYLLSFDLSKPIFIIGDLNIDMLTADR